MTILSTRPVRPAASLLVIACGLGFGVTRASALETFTLENLAIDGAEGKTTIAKVEIVGTNLTKDEAQKLFSAGVSKDDVTSILGKLVASRVTIPQIAVSGPDGHMTATGFQATDIDAGKVGHVALGAFDCDVPGEGGRVTIKSGPIALDGAGLAGIFSAVKSGDMGGATSHFGHFSWQGFEMTAPDKDTPAATPGGNLIKFTLASMIADGTADGDVPLKTSAVIKNLVVTFPPGSEPGQQLAAIGETSVDLGLAFTANYNPAQKTFAIDDFTLSGANFGSLGLKLQLTGIDKALFTGGSNERIGAVMGGGISGAEVRFADAGAAAKALAFAAKAQGAPPAALKAQASEMARQMIPVLLGGNPASTQIAEQVSKFIADPKGITVTARPKGAPVAFMEAFGLADPAAFLARVDVSVQTDGAGAPAAAPPAAVTAQAASPVAPAPAAPPAANQRLTGLAAWNALVGNSITGKNSDDDLMTEFYMPNGKVKQIIDNEISTGDWTVRGQKVCIEYPDDDEETCYTVAIDGNTATFTDEDGDGRRYEILKGNAKKL